MAAALSLALIYGLPVRGPLSLLTLAALCSWLPWPGLWVPKLPTVRQLLGAMRVGIYVSLVMGGVYFVVALALSSAVTRARAMPSSKSN